MLHFSYDVFCNTTASGEAALRDSSYRFKYYKKIILIASKPHSETFVAMTKTSYVRRLWLTPLPNNLKI